MNAATTHWPAPLAHRAEGFFVLVEETGEPIVLKRLNAPPAEKNRSAALPAFEQEKGMLIDIYA